MQGLGSRGRLEPGGKGTGAQYKTDKRIESFTAQWHAPLKK